MSSTGLQPSERATTQTDAPKCVWVADITYLRDAQGLALPRSRA